MAQVINSNISTLTAQRNSNKVQNDLSTAISRLSSGLRINGAKDDAAGLAISERFTTQIRGLNVASRNASDAISMTQTAEGALGATADNLQRIRELAVQAANATVSASDRAALQAEAAARIAEIQRVGTTTQFNGINLLDGSFQNQKFQVGADLGQTINVERITDARASSIGRHTLKTAGALMGTVQTANLSNADGVNSNAVTASADLRLSVGSSSALISYDGSASAKGIADAINGAASSMGVTAKATNFGTMGSLSAAGTVEFKLNGQSVSAAITDQNDLSALVSAINGVATETGVSATFSSPNAKNEITLTTIDGRDISVSEFGILDEAGDPLGATSFSFKGAEDTAAVEVTGGEAVLTGTVELNSTLGAITVSTGDDTAEQTEVFGTTNSSFSSVAALNLSSVEGATQALATIDAALSQINSGRADLGAVQNRFEATIQAVDINAENLSAARSRILDADFAKETANLSRAQVLQQAANAMVAQANQMPQQVLALLQ